MEITEAIIEFLKWCVGGGFWRFAGIYCIFKAIRLCSSYSCGGKK